MQTAYDSSDSRSIDVGYSERCFRVAENHLPGSPVEVTEPGAKDWEMIDELAGSYL